MITLFIVDDEKTTRDCIRDYVPWADLGVEQVKTAENGLAALDLAEQTKPDIVLTDVRMPKMDGIELSGKLRELCPECKIIFISGYSDKEYLKSAIHLKALSYIEKPLNIEEIKSVVRDTVSLCREEERKRLDDLEIRSRISDSLPAVCEKITLDLVKGDFDAAGLQNREYISLLRLPEDTPVCALCVAVNWRFGLEPCAKNKARTGILSALYDPLAGAAGLPRGFLAGFTEDDRLAFLSESKGRDIPALSALLLNMISSLANGQYTVSVGAGAQASGIRGIPGAYRASEQCARLQFYDGFGRVYCELPESQAKYAPGKVLYATFREAIRSGRKETVLELTGKLKEDALERRSGNIESVKNVYFNLLLIVIDAARERGLIGGAEENEQHYVWQEIDRFRFLSELSDYLESNAASVLAQMRTENSENRKICEINRYIRENISDQGLSIQAVAHHFFLNHQYLCSYYKKATGKTLNDYMTEARMEKSRALLKDGRKKIADVAAAVGFGDANYFSSLFKKCTGCTPSEYREKN